MRAWHFQQPQHNFGATSRPNTRSAQSRSAHQVPKSKPQRANSLLEHNSTLGIRRTARATERARKACSISRASGHLLQMISKHLITMRSHRLRNQTHHHAWTGHDESIYLASRLPVGLHVLKPCLSSSSYTKHAYVQQLDILQQCLILKPKFLLSNLTIVRLSLHVDVDGLFQKQAPPVLLGARLAPMELLRDLPYFSVLWIQQNQPANCPQRRFSRMLHSRHYNLVAWPHSDQRTKNR